MPRKIPAILLATGPAGLASANTIWFTRSTGNGRLGGMVFGNPSKERVRLNQESLWAGCPAEAWPDGSSAGLRARGGFTVDAEWKGGKVIRYRIASPEPREVSVRSNGTVQTIRSEKEAPIPATP